MFLFAVVLLDTTKEDSLDWTRYPFGPQSATPGVSISPIFLSSALKSKNNEALRDSKTFPRRTKSHVRCVEKMRRYRRTGFQRFRRVFFLGLMQFVRPRKKASQLLGRFRIHLVPQLCVINGRRDRAFGEMGNTYSSGNHCFRESIEEGERCGNTEKAFTHETRRSAL